MASIPPSGMDLRVTFPKVKIEEGEVKHSRFPQVQLYHINNRICQGKYGLSLSDLLGYQGAEKRERHRQFRFPIGRQTSLETSKYDRRETRRFNRHCSRTARG
jgi:hypothetical protein